MGTTSFHLSAPTAVKLLLKPYYIALKALLYCSLYLGYALNQFNTSITNGSSNSGCKYVVSGCFSFQLFFHIFSFFF